MAGRISWTCHCKTPHAISILQTPVGQGGLGFLCQQHEAALHFLQASLPTVEERPLGDDMEHPFARPITDALEYLEHQAGVPLRPHLLHLQPHRMGGKLRDLFYGARGAQMRDICHWLEPPALPSTPPAEPDITRSWQIQVHMSWYTANHQHLLQEAPLRFALRKHLGLEVFQPGQRCGYTPLSTVTTASPAPRVPPYEGTIA